MELIQSDVTVILNKLLKMKHIGQTETWEFHYQPASKHVHLKLWASELHNSICDINQQNA